MKNFIKDKCFKKSYISMLILNFIIHYAHSMDGDISKSLHQSLKPNQMLVWHNEAYQPPSDLVWHNEAYQPPLSDNVSFGFYPNTLVYGSQITTQELSNTIISGKRIPNYNNINSSNKKTRIESIDFENLNKDKSMEFIIENSLKDNGNNVDIVIEYQNILFSRIYQEFGLDYTQENVIYKDKYHGLPNGYIKILYHHSSHVVDDMVKRYSSLDLFGLFMMYANLGEIKSFNGCVALRRHKLLVKEELEKRANNNDPICLCCLGEVYTNTFLLGKACELGNKRAQFQLAMHYTNNGNKYFYDEECLDWMSDTPGFNTISVQQWGLINLSLNADPTTKMGWGIMKNLASTGHDNAIYYMGKFYEHFGGFPKAYDYYKQSANQKNIKSLNRLSNFNFNEIYNIYKKALDYNNPSTFDKAQRKLGKFFFNGYIHLSNDKSLLKSKVEIEKNYYISEYWLTLNSEKSPKNYFLLAEFFSNSYEDYLKSANNGYYKAQYMLGKLFSGEKIEGFPFINDYGKSINYLTISLKKILENILKYNLDYKFEDNNTLIDKKNYYKFNKYKNNIETLLNVKNTIEKYFINDNFNNDFFSYIIIPSIKNELIYSYKNNFINLPTVLSIDQKCSIQKLKDYFLSNKKVIDIYYNYGDTNYNSENLYSLAYKYFFDSFFVSVLSPVVKLQNLMCKINSSIEKPGFFITCIKPKNQEILFLMESDIFPVEKTEWLFFPENIESDVYEIKNINSILKHQENTNKLIIEILKDKEVSLNIFDYKKCLSLINKFSYIDVDSRKQIEKYLDFTINTIINGKYNVIIEKKVESILHVLSEITSYIIKYNDFLDNVIKLTLHVLTDTEIYRNLLFINKNFKQVSINPFIDFKDIDFKDVFPDNPDLINGTIIKDQESIVSGKKFIKQSKKSKLDGKEDQIMGLLEQKMSLRSIAKVLGVTPTTITNFLEARNIK